MWGDLKTTGEKTEGGFMDDSYNTTVQPSEKDGERKVQCKAILPIMIGRLLHETPKSVLRYGTTVVSCLRVVAIVNKITKSTTKIAYELEDETGSITAYRWLEIDGTTAEDLEGIKENKYVIIHGALRESGEESRHFFIVDIRPMVTYAEVLNHLLEVTVAARFKEEKTKSPDETQGADNYSDTGLTRDQGLIFSLIKGVNENDSGIERHRIKSQVPPQLAPEVDEILDFLVSEGHIYTTRTDDHFKAT